MKDIGLFVDKKSSAATLAFYKQLEEIEFPEGLGLALNNIEGSRSGILLKDGKVIEISLANCYTLQDVIREMARLIMAPRYDKVEDIEHF